MRHTLWRCIKWALFHFDSEWIHCWMIRGIRLGHVFRNKPLILFSGVDLEKEESSIDVMGMPFLSQVGLAAGFDKNAEILESLPALGFGFAEIGTVTPLPQSGNDRPRLFRDPGQATLFNRMGFNNLGAITVAARIRKSRPHLPKNFRIGVNLGKNKETPLNAAKDDYACAVKAFEGLADYLVINVSSPNTPGLRSLQTLEALKPIVYEIRQIIDHWTIQPPLFLKLAPELSLPLLVEMVQTLESFGIDGWVLTNTLSGSYSLGLKTLEGGWSGKCLTHLSMTHLIEIRKISKKPVISVGGIHSCDEARARIQAGANLIQIYTGWIYDGPTFPNQLNQAIRNGSKLSF